MGLVRVQGILPHTNKKFNTSKVSKSVSQFWHYFLRDTRFHMLMAQSHKTALHLMPVASWCQCFWLTGYTSEVLMTTSLVLINLLKHLTGLRKPVSSLDYQITKDVKGYKSIARWRDTLGDVLSEGASVLMEDRAWKLSQLCPVGFYRGFITQAWMI